MHPDKMIERVKFWLDVIRAPRFKINFNYIPSLQIAMDDHIKALYDNIKDANGRVFFESVERVRDALYTLIVEADCALTGNTSVEPSDYRYEAGMLSTIDGNPYRSKQITYNEVDDVEQGLNSFTKPSTADNNVYHLKTSNGFRSVHGAGTLSKMHLRYIKKHKLIQRSETAIAAGATALTIGDEYYVLSSSVIVNAITYNAADPSIPGSGDTFVAIATAMTGLGTVVKIVRCELPEGEHEEVCKRAADILATTVDDAPKAGAVKMQEKVS